jgi:hypothetical protein
LNHLFKVIQSGSFGSQIECILPSDINLNF